MNLDKKLSALFDKSGSSGTQRRMQSLNSHKSNALKLGGTN